MVDEVDVQHMESDRASNMLSTRASSRPDRRLVRSRFI